MKIEVGSPTYEVGDLVETSIDGKTFGKIVEVREPDDLFVIELTSVSEEFGGDDEVGQRWLVEKVASTVSVRTLATPLEQIGEVTE
jgi:hypothetical protein